MKRITLLLFAFFLSWQVSAQCDPGISAVSLTTSGGSFPTEKWVNITTAANGGGTVVWAQGNGTYGNGAGFLSNVTICLAPGSYYINCYDKYADGWDGTKYTVSSYGNLLANNGDVSPNNPADADLTSSWETPALELESSEMFTVLAPPSCLPPTGLTSGTYTSSGAAISWTAAVPAPSEGYQYYYSKVNVAPTSPTENTGTVGAGVLTASLSSLDSATQYFFWVRSACGDDEMSPWSASANFTTLCGVYTPSPTFSNNFTTFPGTCWTRSNAGTKLTGPTGAGNGNWASKSYLNTGSNSAASFNLYGNSTVDSHWLISPSINLAAIDYRLKYNVGLTYYGTAAAGTIGSDVIEVLITDDAGLTWDVLKTYNTANAPTNSGALETIDLSAYSGVVKIAFLVTDNLDLTSVQDADFFIDNFLIEVIPNCESPTALAASNVTLNTATISWNAPATAPADGYEYYYSDENTAPVSAGTEVAGTSANLSGLDSNTVYYSWVRSVCGDGNESAWISLGSFTTLCAPQGLPYVMPLAAAVVPAIPECTVVQNVNADNKTWVSYASTTGITGKVVGYPYHGSNAANDWLYTRALNLTAGQSYRLKFKYKDTGFVEKLKVAIGTSTASTAMTTELFDVSTGVLSAVVEKNIDFTVDADGVYFIGFQCYSAADQNILYLGEISVIVTPTDTVDFGNLQAIVQGNNLASTIQTCQSVDVYAQAWENGVTEAEGQAPGLVAWIGYSTENTDPATWSESAFTLATFNDAYEGNNDEFKASYEDLPIGVYYFASRFQLNGGPYRYGATNNGFWNEASNPNAVLTVVAPSEIEASSDDLSICVGESAALSVTSENDNYTYVWDNSLGAGASFNVSPTATTTYTVVATDTLTGCTVSDSVTIVVNLVPSELEVNVEAATVCANSVLELAATGGIVEGNVVSGSGVLTTVGDVTGSTLGPNPLQNFYGGTKQQWLYTAAELEALGFVQGTEIEAIKLNLATANTTYALQNLVVKMKNSALTSFATATSWETGLTTVKAAANYTPAVGLNNFDLDAPFVWDGTSSLVIEMNYSNNNGGASGTKNTAKYSATSFASTLFYRADNGTAAAIDAYVGAATNRINFRTDVSFDFTSAASVVWSPATNLYTDEQATIAYVGGSSSRTVYAKPSADISYEAIANTSNCSSGVQSVVITVVSPVEPNFVAIAPICAGDTAPLLGLASPSGITGTWSPSVVDNMASADYVFTPDAGQCAVPHTLSVTVNPVVVPNFAAIDPICAGDTAPVLALTSPNGVTGTWTPATVDTTADGSYTFLPDAGQCSVPQILTVTVNALPSLVVTSPAAICSSGTVDITADAVTAGSGAGLTFSYWADPFGNVTFPAPDAIPSSGTFYIKAENANGCSVIMPVTVVVKEAVEAPTTASPTQDFSTGDDLGDFEVTGSGLIWYDAATDGNVLPSATVITTGTVYYVSQTVDGCESENRLMITAGVDLRAPGFDAVRLNYYPNPVSDFLTITSSSAIESVEVYNVLGQRVYQNVYNSQEVKVDMGVLATGNYIVNVKSNGLIKNIKVMRK